MSYDDYETNEALVNAMLGNQKYENNAFDLGYLTSFLASAMQEIPELKERVRDRILSQIERGAA